MDREWCSDCRRDQLVWIANVPKASKPTRDDNKITLPTSVRIDIYCCYTCGYRKEIET